MPCHPNIWAGITDCGCLGSRWTAGGCGVEIRAKPREQQFQSYGILWVLPSFLARHLLFCVSIPAPILQACGRTNNPVGGGLPCGQPVWMPELSQWYLDQTVCSINFEAEILFIAIEIFEYGSGHETGCLVTWFCYQLIAKPGNKTATVSWPDPLYAFT